MPNRIIERQTITDDLPQIQITPRGQRAVYLMQAALTGTGAEPCKQIATARKALPPPSQLRSSQSQRISNNGYRAETHRQGRNHRGEENSEYRKEYTCSDRHAQCVIDQSKEEVLTYIPHRFVAQVFGFYNPLQVPFHQGDHRALNRHIRSGTHGNTDITLCECRSVVNSVARNGNHLPLLLKPFHFIQFI